MGNTQCAHNITQGAHIRACDFGGTLARAFDRLGDDLNQRDTGTVVVDERMVSAFDTAVGATHVGVLASVVFDMRTFNRHAEDRAVIQFDIQVAVAVGRLVILRDLVVARHIRVEVVLAGELAPFGDFAMQGEAQLDGEIDRSFVDHRQASRQAEAHRGQLGVRFAAELDMRRAEQFGVRAQFDVGLQADHRVEPLDGFREFHQFFSHLSSSSGFRRSATAWPSS